MRGKDYEKGRRGMACVRSEFKILRHVFTKAIVRLDARNDYRLSTVCCWIFYRESIGKQDQNKKCEKSTAG